MREIDAKGGVINLSTAITTAFRFTKNRKDEIFPHVSSGVLLAQVFFHHVGPITHFATTEKVGTPENAEKKLDYYLIYPTNHQIPINLFRSSSEPPQISNL